MEAILSPPNYKMDGAHGFLVALASAVCLFLNSALITASSSIYFVLFRDYFQASSNEIATITLLPACLVVSCGPIASFLYEFLGCRATVILSGIITSVGFAGAYFAQNTTHLLVCFLLIGAGLGVKMTAEISVLTQYFDKYQKFALGIVFVSGSVGIGYASVLVEFISTFTWRGAMLIQAGIVLQIVVCGAVMRSRRPRSRPKFVHFFSFSMLRDPLVLAGCCATMSQLSRGCVFINFITALVVDRGLTMQTSALLLTISVGPNFLVRLVAPFLAHHPKCNTLIVLSVCCSLTVLADIAVTFCRSFLCFMLAIGLEGAGFGGYMSLLMVVPVELYGPEKLPRFLALVSIPNGICLLLVPRLAGYLADNFGLESVFYLGAAFGSLTTAIYALIGFYRNSNKI